MRILIITPYFKPYQTPRAYRWTQIAHYLSSLDHEIHIITSNDHELGDEHSGLTIHRIGYSTPDKRWLNDVSPRRLDWIPPSIKKWTKTLFWPDVSKNWIKPALNCANSLLKEFPADLIITVSLPFSSHVIGLQIKKMHHLPWLADIGDPFKIGIASTSDNGLGSKREIKILNQCDCISVTNAPIQQKYQSILNLTAENIKVIGPMSSPLIDVPSKSVTPRSYKFGYFGTFYEGVRDAEKMVQGLIELSKLSNQQDLDFHLYGNIKEHFKKRIEEKFQENNLPIYFHDNIDRKNVVAIMSNFDVLVCVGNKNITQLPSKVIDYVLAKRPIIHFPEEKNDTVIKFLQDYPNFILYDYNNPMQSFQDISKCINQASDSHEFLKSIRNKYSPTSIASEYFSIIEKMVKRTIQ